jgi:ABC-type Zn uptake system ZnuABC Zn-binding protein ZnuA
MKTSFHTLLALLAVAVLGGAASPASAKIKIAASLTDLASIASTVGGDQVEVFAIARATSDPHRVEVLPSYMVQVSRAQLYLKVGLGLDQWADGIIDGARSTKLQILDCGKEVTVLDKPAQVNASMGDVHPFGNPHYWLDPRNGAIVAKEIAGQLATMDPAHAAGYQARADAFGKDAEATLERGQKLVGTMPVKAIFTYHSSWVYLAHAYGLEIVATAEPVPGIPPTAKHLAELVQLARERKIPLLLQEPYFSEDAGKFLARETGLRVVKASPSCDGPEAGSYLKHFDSLVAQLVAPSGAAAN